MRPPGFYSPPGLFPTEAKVLICLRSNASICCILRRGYAYDVRRALIAVNLIQCSDACGQFDGIYSTFGEVTGVP